MRKTKIICTIGPACENEETLTEMCLAGMNVARLKAEGGLGRPESRCSGTCHVSANPDRLSGWYAFSRVSSALGRICSPRPQEIGCTRDQICV